MRGLLGLIGVISLSLCISSAIYAQSESEPIVLEGASVEGLLFAGTTYLCSEKTVAIGFNEVPGAAKIMGIYDFKKFQGFSNVQRMGELMVLLEQVFGGMLSKTEFLYSPFDVLYSVGIDTQKGSPTKLTEEEFYVKLKSTFPMAYAYLKGEPNDCVLMPPADVKKVNGDVEKKIEKLVPNNLPPTP